MEGLKMKEKLEFLSCNLELFKDTPKACVRHLNICFKGYKKADHKNVLDCFPFGDMVHLFRNVLRPINAYEGTDSLFSLLQEGG